MSMRFGMNIDGGIDQRRHLFNVKLNRSTLGCQPNLLSSQLFSKTLDPTSKSWREDSEKGQGIDLKQHSQQTRALLPLYT